MSKVDQQAAFLQDAAKLIQKAPQFGLTITGGELFRTQEQQDLHFASGNPNCDIVYIRIASRSTLISSKRVHPEPWN